ncbi:hypothetical protein RRG08_003725 [Elysia crispata]|uniref:Uncharacterized protein n=1 Tax=Elysia crispata TaxID=231223 RepID=A0AAE1AWI4_9GAST|nr:hypothetical protein RRG08_003725 [Elysia crispata]
MSRYSDLFNRFLNFIVKEATITFSVSFYNELVFHHKIIGTGYLDLKRCKQTYPKAQAVCRHTEDNNTSVESRSTPRHRVNKHWSLCGSSSSSSSHSQVIVKEKSSPNNRALTYS